MADLHKHIQEKIDHWRWRMPEFSQFADHAEKILKRHERKTDPPYSLIDYTYCSCGAMDVHQGFDGDRVIGPVKWPCPDILDLAECWGVEP
jgi:hypothetical protein